MRHVLFLTLRQLSFVWRLLPLAPSRHYLWRRAQAERKVSSKPAAVFFARFLIQSWGRWHLNAPLLNTTPWQPKSYIWGFDRQLVELKRRDSLRFLHSGGVVLRDRTQRRQSSLGVELSQFVPYIEFSAWGGKTALRQWYWNKCFRSAIKGASGLSFLTKSFKRSEVFLFTQLFCDKVFNNCAQFYSKSILGALMPILSDTAAGRLSGIFWANFLSQLSLSSLDQNYLSQDAFMNLDEILAEGRYAELTYPLKDSMHACGIFAIAKLKYVDGYDVAAFYTLAVKTTFMFNFIDVPLWWVACWYLLVDEIDETRVPCCIATGVKNRPMQKQGWVFKSRGQAYRPTRLHPFTFIKTRQANAAFKFRRGGNLGLETKTLSTWVGSFLRDVLTCLLTQSRKSCALLALSYKKCVILRQGWAKAWAVQLHYTAYSAKVSEQWAPFLKSRWYPKVVHDCSFVSWHHVGVLIAKRYWLELALRLLRLRYRWGSPEYKYKFDTLNLFTTKLGIELLEHTPLAEMPFLWRMVWHLILRWEFWPARKRRAHTYKPEVEPVFSLAERVRDRDYNLTKWEASIINQYSVSKLKVTGLSFLILFCRYLVAKFLFYFRLLGIRVFDFIFWVIDRILLVYSILVLHLIWICVSFFYEYRGLYLEYEKKLINNQALTFKEKIFIYSMRIFLWVLYLLKAINTFLVCTCYFLCADIRRWPWWAAVSSKVFWWTRAINLAVIFYFWLWNLTLKLIFFPTKFVHTLIMLAIYGFGYISKGSKITWAVRSFFFKEKK